MKQKENKKLELLDINSYKTLKDHKKVLVSMERFNNKVAEVYNSNKKKNKIKGALIDKFNKYDDVVESYRLLLEEEFNGKITFKLYPRSLFYQVDCMLIILESGGGSCATN